MSEATTASLTTSSKPAAFPVVASAQSAVVVALVLVLALALALVIVLVLPIAALVVVDG